MLPWLMERREVAVAEMAAHFRLSEAELVADLELASLCGLPPYVDEMLDVFVDEGRIYAGVPRVFTKPLQLTAPEGFALLAAGRAALALPGADPAGPLGRALDKLEQVLGGGLAVDLPRPPLTDDLAEAVARGAVLAIRYWVPSRDEVTERRITPRSVFTDRGYWYVRADDDRSGEERCFRVDRIDGLVDTGERAARREVEPGPPAWFRDADVERVVLRLAPSAAWVAEWYPADDVEELGGGARRVTLPVSSPRWLTSLLLRVGPDAVVEAPPHWRDAARQTAARLLERYRTSTTSS
jgi:proteasome accessory factor C